MNKCYKCIHKSVCIDDANYKYAESCNRYLDKDSLNIVRYGKWNVGYFHDRVCSICCHPDNDLNDFPHTYCPNCGAKMDIEKAK